MVKCMYLGLKEINSKDGKKWTFLSFLVDGNVIEIVDTESVNLSEQIKNNAIKIKDDCVLSGIVKVRNSKDNRKYLSYEVQKIQKA